MMPEERKQKARPPVSRSLDQALFDGLLLVDAHFQPHRRQFSGAIFVIWQGEAFQIARFDDETQAHAWLADALRLVAWNRSGLDADPSGLYSQQQGVPARVKRWKQLQETLESSVSDEDYAAIFSAVGVQARGNRHS